MSWDDFQVQTDLATDLKREIGRQSGGKVIEIDVQQADDDEIAVVAYAAVETEVDGSRSVEAAVALLVFDSDNGENQYMIKVMSEFEAPIACECPSRILNILSPTDSEYALEWRQRASEAAACEPSPVRAN